MQRLEYQPIAAQLLRALRGQRSQAAANRKLRARSNVLYTWESGRRWPTAARFFVFAERMGIDVRASLRRFYGREPDWLQHQDPATPAGVAALLNDLRAERSVAELARSMGRTRSTVSRWLAGRTQPRLPELLQMIEASSLRLLDFVAELTDPASMPALAKRWRALEASRRVAYDAPWAHAVLRALELESYRQLPAHVPGWLARCLGISPQAEAEALELLRRGGQIRFTRKHWRPTSVMTVDTSRDRRAELSLKTWAARIGLERLQDVGDDLFSFNLFTVSSADLARLRDLQRAFFRQQRAIVADSQPAEHVVIANLQLFEVARRA